MTLTTPKILLVDDELPFEALLRRHFRKEIRAKEIELLFANNGLEALNKLSSDGPVDLVITDINMPEMDGLTLLGKIAEFDPTIKTVVLSAYGDMKNIRTAMNQGAFDFLNKPIDFQDLEITIRRALAEVEIIRENQRKLVSAQTQLIQSEKMSALGQLVAGVAHEINNPLGYITGNIEIAQQYLEDLIELIKTYQTYGLSLAPEVQKKVQEIGLDDIITDMPMLISAMREGTERILFLTSSLRTFSRSDLDNAVVFNIHDGLESTILILKYRLKSQKNRPTVEIERNYGELPQVKCYAGQLNQVFMNIISNAIDSFEMGNLDFTKVIPTIQITTAVNQENQSVVIRISDNGVGMTTAVKEKIFNYLYTTKPVGVGTGLGLHISREIVVEKHGGKLSCESELGVGSTFIIEIPI